MLKGKSVVLKTIAKEDIKLIFDIIMEDKVGSTFSTTYKELTLDGLPKFLYETETGTTSKVFSIFDDKELIGVVTVNCIHAIRRSAYLAYLCIKSEYQKSGLGKDAFSVLLKYCFDTLNLNRVYSHTFSDNQIFQKDNHGIGDYFGFKLEGVEREYVYRNGNYVDKQIWGLLRKEWRNNPIYEHDAYKTL